MCSSDLRFGVERPVERPVAVCTDAVGAPDGGGVASGGGDARGLSFLPPFLGFVTKRVTT